MKKILYVDDEKINRKLFSKLMNDYDVEVKLLEDGLTALSVLEEEQFDLIFLDHIMPNMSGMEVLTNVQSMEYSPNTYTPFVALTANPIDNAEELYLDAGFSAYMKKPIEKGSMENIMERFLPGTNKAKVAAPPPEPAKAPETPVADTSSTGGEVLDAKAIEEMFYSTAAAQAPPVDNGPIWIQDSDLIDYEEGIRINGSEEDYFDTLHIFKDMGVTKTMQLQKAYEEMDINNYGMLTHSLKSAAAIIGADKLSHYAEFMEKACNNGDEEAIKVDHDDFMKSYSDVITLLDRHLVDKPKVEFEKIEYEPEGLRKTILLITSKENITTRAIINHLTAGRYSVDKCPPIPDVAAIKVIDAELVIYNMDDYIYSRIDILTFLKEKCVEMGKGLMLVGESNDYEYVKNEMGENYINAWHNLPLEIDVFMKSVNYYFDNYEVMSRLRHRILIVDDDEIYTSTVEHWLGGLYEIAVANSAVDAMSSVDRKKPDLILLDYEMPVTDGPKFLEYIRSDESTANISVIFLTGSQDRESVTRVLELAPNGYLLKSIDKSTLIDRINTFFMTGKVG
ncbi:MAG: response regulator [Lachnospiraceae bacterium]|nr:response regulator [Lachnospiraceae bacterium]